MNKRRNVRNKKKTTLYQKINNAFDGDISRLYMAEEIISELKDILMETSMTDKNQNKINKNHGTTTKGVTYM